MRKTGAISIIFLITCFYFILLGNQALAVTCETLHVNFTGKCIDTAQACPTGMTVDNSRTNLCPTSQKCCAKTAPESATDLKPTSAEDVKLQVPIFDFSEANNLAQYIAKIYQYILIIFVPLTIIMIIWGGIQWIMAAGEAGKITAAKKQITQAFVGLFIGLFSYTILSLVGITQITQTGMGKIGQIAGEEITMADLDLGNASAPAGKGISPADFTAAKGANPFQAICDEYHGNYSESIALKCKALGTNTPPGADFVKTEDGYWLDRKFFAALTSARACVKETHANAFIKINGPVSAYRSPEEQYSMWKKKNGSGVAKPCCSNHGGGVAADISFNYDITSCMNKNGLYGKIPSERWHWSFTGR